MVKGNCSLSYRGKNEQCDQREVVKPPVFHLISTSVIGLGLRPLLDLRHLRQPWGKRATNSTKQILKPTLAERCSSISPVSGKPVRGPAPLIREPVRACELVNMAAAIIY